MNRFWAAVVATFVAVMTPLVGWAFIAHPMPHGLIGFVLLPAICGFAVYRLLMPDDHLTEWRREMDEEWHDYITRARHD